jgi:hypothetical protein
MDDQRTWIDLFNDALNSRIREYADQMINGHCKDWNAYQKMSGTVAGIREAAQIITQLMKDNSSEEA